VTSNAPHRGDLQALVQFRRETGSSNRQTRSGGGLGPHLRCCWRMAYSMFWRIPASSTLRVAFRETPSKTVKSLGGRCSLQKSFPVRARAEQRCSTHS